MRLSSLAGLLLLLSSCDSTEPSGPTRTLNDTIVIDPARFAGVPGSSAGFVWQVRDTLGLGMSVHEDSLTWTILDSAVAGIGGHDWTTLGIAGLAPGNTEVWVSYNGDTTRIPVEVATATFTALVAGSRNTCALDTDQRLYCWGFNLDNRNAQPYGQTNVGPVRPPVDQQFTAIDNSVTHACGITPGNVLKCWGGNAYGERGSGEAGPSFGIWAPVTVSGGHQFEALTVGAGITCGLTTSGFAYCWGRNYRGELGVGDTLNRSVPTAVSGGIMFTQISADGPNLDAMATHTCGLDDTGHVWCWGSNDYGQLGDGTNVRRLTPTPVDTARTFTQVAVGGGSTCALGSDQRVYCWGDNQHGQLGRDTTSVNLPVAIASEADYIGLSFGEAHACAVTVAGAIHCWGDNGYGQLGRGTVGDGTHPDVAPVTGATTWEAVSAGWRHSCGRATTGVYYCWGGQDVEAGTGAAPSGTPAPVMGQAGLGAAP